MTTSPLGKYSQAVAAVIALGVIGTALVLHFLGRSDTFIDNVALLALGAVFGAAATTSVNAQTIQAAHRRLDEISAPPADQLEVEAIERGEHE